MAGITLSDLSNILEKIIRPAVEDQLYGGTILWNMFGGYQADGGKNVLPKKNMNVLKTDLDNQTFYIPLVTGHSSGAVSIAEGGTLVAGKPATSQAQVSATYATGTFQITKQTLKVKEAGVAVKQLDFFMKQNALAMTIDLTRQCYSDGTGTIGTANALGSSSTAFTFKASPNGDIDYTRYTPVGTQLIIGSNSAVSVSAITGVNQITLSSALSWNAADAVKKADGAGAAASEMPGLNLAVVNSGNYQNIATNNVWTPGYYDNNSGTNKALANADLNKMYIQGSRIGKPKYLLMNGTEFTAYGNLQTSNIRFDYKDVLGGGWTALNFMGGNAQVVLDFDCPDDHIFQLTPDFWSLGEMDPFSWEQGTNGVLLRIQGTLNYEVTGTWFGNLLNFARGANSALANRVG